MIALLDRRFLDQTVSLMGWVHRRRDHGAPDPGLVGERHPGVLDGADGDVLVIRGRINVVPRRTRVEQVCAARVVWRKWGCSDLEIGPKTARQNQIRSLRQKFVSAYRNPSRGDD